MVVEDNNIKEKPEGHTITWYLVQLAILLVVVGLGIFAVNQALEYKYRSVFLQTPCNVCKELNSNQSTCIDNCFKYRIEVVNPNPTINISTLKFTSP